MPRGTRALSFGTSARATLETLDDIRIAAARVDRARFAADRPDPVLLLWQVVEGDQQFAAPGAFAAEPREGNTLVHVPRVSPADRVRDSMQPGRTVLVSPRWVGLGVVDGAVPLDIGRDRKRAIRLNDYTISAVHVRVWGVPRTERRWVEDADSRNGTVHNGVSLLSGYRSELVSGDELVIGKFALLFLSPADFHRYLRGEL